MERQIQRLRNENSILVQDNSAMHSDLLSLEKHLVSADTHLKNVLVEADQSKQAPSVT